MDIREEIEGTVCSALSNTPIPSATSMLNASRYLSDISVTSVRTNLRRRASLFRVDLSRLLWVIGPRTSGLPLGWCPSGYKRVTISESFPVWLSRLSPVRSYSELLERQDLSRGQTEMNPSPYRHTATSSVVVMLFSISYAQFTHLAALQIHVTGSG
jgi:hypothetical protein